MTEGVADIVRDGLLGLLVGDACGVPYEFKRPQDLPRWTELEMVPPAGFNRSYPQVPLGNWSDDGAQALCLYESLRVCGGFHGFDFASRLVKWHDRGYLAVGHYVFDIGNQTAEAIRRIKSGHPLSHSGPAGERNNGNGSLMRCLPLALLCDGPDAGLVEMAHKQSRVTHGHARAEACCALYCLWARREREAVEASWEGAVDSLRKIYAEGYPRHLEELEQAVEPDRSPSGNGTGYVVDSLHSARLACWEADYRSIVRRAIALGNDTDTTACVAGGIGGIRHGMGGIPEEWLQQLRGWEILEPRGLGRL